jgi:radical SAM superfamily enzyme YgiQ (UPF0313 family)
MRILFVSPNWKNFKGFWCSCRDKHQQLEYLYPATLLQKNHTVGMLDLYNEDLTIEQGIAKIKDWKPDAVVIGTTQSYLSWRCCPTGVDLPMELSQAIKENVKTTVIVIGPHVSVSHEHILEDFNADFAIRGEPELSLVNFIVSGMKDKTIKGVAGKDFDNGVVSVEDLGELPQMDYGLVRQYDFHAHHDVPYKKGALAEFSRGCLFQCDYCFIQVFRRKFRTRPIKKVIGELRQLKEMGYEYVYFIDELFNNPTKELIEFLEELKKIGIKFGCECRPDIMKKEIVDKMKEAGCVLIEYGVESFNPEIRKKLRKNINFENVMDIVNYTVNTGIKTMLFLLYGFPTETKETLALTRMQLLAIDKRVLVGGSPIAIYPTVPLYAEVFGKPEKIGRKEWDTTVEKTGNLCPLPLHQIGEFAWKTYWDHKLKVLNLPAKWTMFLTDLIFPFIRLKRKLLGEPI